MDTFDKNNVTVRIYGLVTNNDSDIKYVGKTVDALHRRLNNHKSKAKTGTGLDNTNLDNWIKANDVKIILLEEVIGTEIGNKAEKYWIKHYKPTFNIALTNFSVVKKMPRRKINQYNLDGSLIKTWNGIMEANRTLNIKDGTINSALKRKGIGSGYLWTYENEELNININPNYRQTPIIVIDLFTNKETSFNSIKEACIQFKWKRNGFLTRCLKNGITYKNRYKLSYKDIV